MSEVAEFLYARTQDDKLRAETLDAIAYALPSETAEYLREIAGQMLRDVEAKMQIVRSLDYARPGSDYWKGVMIQVGFLAAAYADHEDYREEWKP